MYGITGPRAVPGERVPPARLRRASCSAGCCRGSPASRRSACPTRWRRSPSAAARARARDRPRRLGQDRDARGDGRPRQHAPRGPHRHHRGPGRGAARRQALDRRPARGRHRHAERGVGPRARAPPGPRRHRARRAPRRPTPRGRCSRRPRSGTSCSPACRRSSAVDTIDRFVELFPPHRQRQARAIARGDVARHRLAAPAAACRRPGTRARGRGAGRERTRARAHRATRRGSPSSSTR